ncbi:hypothetical protein [Amycolatopsis sp.]|uniref:hypothetical protein n=1 Tax=Amycolatopsis sp. TaxID=37632 RepID=UPI002E02D155|nr:hypothetical protein [Amycolatopsis sp.]
MAIRGSAAEDAVASNSDTDDRDDPIPDIPDDRPVVRGELHRQAFEILGILYESHGAATGIRIVRMTSPEDLFAQLEELVQRPDRPNLAALADEIARGQNPAGIMAVAAGRSYTSALVQRAAGLLVAVAADDEEHGVKSTLR